MRSVTSPSFLFFFFFRFHSDKSLRIVSNAVPILSLRGEAKMKLTRDKCLLDNSNHTRCEIKLISRNILDSVDRYEPIKILGNIDEHRRVFEFSKGRVEPF